MAQLALVSSAAGARVLPDLFFALGLGAGSNYLGFGVMPLLFWWAVVNGVLAPP